MIALINDVHDKNETEHITQSNFFKEKKVQIKIDQLKTSKSHW